MNTKAKIIVAVLDLLSLLLVLAYPGRSTMASLFGIFALHSTYQIANELKFGRGYKAIESNLGTLFTVLICAGLLLLSTNSQIINGEIPQEYTIKLNEDIALFGGCTLSYRFFAIAVWCFGVILEAKDFLRTLNFTHITSFDESVQDCVN